MQNKTTLKRILQGCKNTLMILCLSIWCMSLNAQTISTAGGSNYSGSLSIGSPDPLNVSFVIQNTTGTAIALTSVSTQMGPFGGVSVAGDASVTKLFVSSTSLSGVYDYSTAAWTQIGSGSAVVPAALAVVPVITGITYVIPAGAQLRFVLELSKGLRISSNLAGDPMPTPNVFSAGGFNLQLGNFQIAGQNVGFGGVAPSAPLTNTPVFFGGSVTLSPVVACTGTPTPGNTVSSASSVCPATPFTLSVSTPAVPGTTGLAYQWQSSATGVAGSFANIAGAQNATYTATLSSSTFYRVQVSCGANVGTSIPVQVTSNPVTSCYCAAGANNTTFEKISNVTLNSINNTTTSTAGYENFTALSTSLTPGQPYPLSVTVSQPFAADQVIVWIDYNQNGVFTDAGENVYTSLPGFPVVAPATVTGTLIVPFSALPGTTRMRVRMHDTSFGANATSCGNSDYGQVEDYSINISSVVPCAGTPTPGNTISSVPTICSGVGFTLSLQNFTSGSGITYQWQSSATGVAGSFTNITGANAVLLTTTQSTATYYQAVVTCGANSGTSTPILVALSPFTNCYCNSAATSNADEDIFNVSIGSLNNSSTCASVGPGPGSINRRYANYKSGTGAPAAPEVFLGTSMPFSVTIGTCGGNFSNSVAAWIDFNRDGAFTAAERVYVSAGGIVGAHTETGFATIPASALPGITGMRVISVATGAPATIQPCAVYARGETEDYLVNIVPCVPVLLTQQPVSSSIQCGANTSFTVAASGSLPSFFWQYKTSAGATTWLDVPNTAPYSGVMTSTLTITNASASLNGYVYRAVFRGACTGVDFSTAATLTVTPLIATVNPASASICNGTVQALSISNSLGNSVTFTEGFNTAVPLPTGWFTRNNSNPLGTVGWFQGQATTFPSFSGAPNSYIAANFQNTTTSGTISNWLLTPSVSIKNGDFITFYSRIPAGTEFPDRLEVRLSSNGASTNVGTAATDLGDFTTLLLSINPTLVTGVYPKAWTQFTATVSGLAAPATGRIGFRYFVTNGGSADDNSNFIGIDEVAYTSVGGFAQGVWTGPAGTIFTDPAASSVYVTGTPTSTVYVKPTTTSNYTVVVTTATCVSSVTTIPVTVSNPIVGTASTTNKSVCIGGTTSFTATLSAGATGNIIRHQWKLKVPGGTTFTNVPNNATYSGGTTATLTITNATAALNGYQYMDSLFVTACNSFVLTNAGTLTVNPLPVIVLTASPFTAIYPGQTTTLSAAVSPNAAATYTWFRDGAVVAGAAASTLVVDVDKLGLYTVRVNDVNGCTATSAGVRITAAGNDLLFIYPSPNTGQFQVRFFSQLGSSPFPRTVSVFDSKGSRIYTRSYPVTSAYTRLDVDLKNHPKGIYSVELTDSRGNRLKTGRVLVL